MFRDLVRRGTECSVEIVLWPASQVEMHVDD